MYRPEGMKKGIEVRDNKKRYTSTDLNQAYELGADAMLEGLIKQHGEYVADWQHDEQGRNGHIVFIPEEGR